MGFDDDSIIVSHSSGAIEILGLLQNLTEDVVIRRAYLVAVFINDLGWEALKSMGILNDAIEAY